MASFAFSISAMPEMDQRRKGIPAVSWQEYAAMSAGEKKSFLPCQPQGHLGAQGL